MKHQRQALIGTANCSHKDVPYILSKMESTTPTLKKVQPIKVGNRVLFRCERQGKLALCFPSQGR